MAKQTVSENDYPSVGLKKINENFDELYNGYEVPSTTQVLTAAGNTILANAKTVNVDNTSGGSLTLTSLPTIADGASGQRLRIVNVGTQPIVLRDEAVAAGSNLHLGGANHTLLPKTAINLFFSAATSTWIKEV